jgi:perosamine synthetase
MTLLAHEIGKVLLRVQGEKSGELHAPWFPEESRIQVLSSIASTMVSTYGPQVSEVERVLAATLEIPGVALFSSGTVALQTLLEAFGPLDGRIVFCPSLTFVATANAIVLANGTPFFYDLDDQFDIDIEKLESEIDRNFRWSGGQLLHLQSGRAVAGIVAVDLYGHVSNIKDLLPLRDKFNIFLVEDAAAALGSTRDHLPPGSLSDGAIISFNGNKILTAGGGGAVISRNANIIDVARIKSNTAKIPHKFKFQHSSLSSNLRMPALNAGLLLGQLTHLSEIVKAHTLLHRQYQMEFESLDSVEIFHGQNSQDSNSWINLCIIKDFRGETLDSLCEQIIDSGIAVRPMWEPMHLQSHLKQFPSTDMSNTLKLSRSVLALPSTPWKFLSLDD